jgi:transposase
LHRIRERHIRNQTSLVNEVRGLLLEYGRTVPEGINYVRALLPTVVQNQDDYSACLRRALGKLHEELLQVTEAIEEIDKDLETFCKENELCRNLDEIEGVGPLTATALVAYSGNPYTYKNGRQFAASIGLTPGHTQTGGKNSAPIMLGITKKGNAYLRTLLVQGGMSLVRATQATKRAEEKKAATEKAEKEPKLTVGVKGVGPCRKRNKTKAEQEKFHQSQARRQWLSRLIEEKGTQKAAVAMANKNARIAWVLLTKKVKYNPDKRFSAAA